MKRFRKIALVLVTLMFGTMFMACGDKEEPAAKVLTPGECLKIQLDVELFGKGDEKSKIGITDAEFKKSLEMREQMINQAFGQAELQQNMQGLSSEDMKKFIDQVLAGLSKCPVTYGEAKIEGEVATLDVTIKGIDMAKVMEQMISKALAAMMSNPNATEEESMKIMMNVMGEIFANPPIVAEGKKVTVTMKKVGEYWKADQTELTKITEGYMQNMEGMKGAMDGLQ